MDAAFQGPAPTARGAVLQVPYLCPGASLRHERPDQARVRHRTDRLRKPLAHYQKKYGTPSYGLQKLFLLMEKQHNRGQDGAGMATIKLDPEPGLNYIDRERSIDKQAIQTIFGRIGKAYQQVLKGHEDKADDTDWLKRNVPYLGELLLGHLRYATYGQNSTEQCHPRRRLNNWMTRNLVVAATST